MNTWKELIQRYGDKGFIDFWSFIEQGWCRFSSIERRSCCRRRIDIACVLDRTVSRAQGKSILF